MLAGRGVRTRKARSAHALLKRGAESLRSVIPAYEKKPKTVARMGSLLGDVIAEGDHLEPYFGRKYPWAWIADTVGLAHKDLLGLLAKRKL